MYPYLDHDGPIAMAHRGGALHPENIGYENSLHAFEHAVDLGYRYLETDLHATSDGVVIAFHDSRLDRVTDRTGVIAELPWSEVQQGQDQRPRAHPPAGRAARALPGDRFNLDIKAENGLKPAADVLRAAERDRPGLRLVVLPVRVRRIRRELGPTPVHRVRRLGDRADPVPPVRAAVDGACLQIPERYGPLRVLTPG